MQFNFNFGNKNPGIKEYAIIGIVLTTLIGGLSRCTKLPENFFWDLLDEFQRHHDPQSPINKYIIHDEGLLKRRIHRDVDRAIQEYEDLTGDHGHVKLPSPRYIEEPMDGSKCHSKECRSLGPPMRLCSPWWDRCPDSSKAVTDPLTKP